MPPEQKIRGPYLNGQWIQLYSGFTNCLNQYQKELRIMRTRSSDPGINKLQRKNREYIALPFFTIDFYFFGLEEQGESGERNHESTPQ